MVLPLCIRAGLSAAAAAALMFFIVVAGAHGGEVPGAPPAIPVVRSTTLAGVNNKIDRAQSKGANWNSKIKPVLSNDVYKTVQDVRKCFTVLSGAAAEYKRIRETHDRIEFLLKGTCNGLQDRLKWWDHTRAIFWAVKKVPLGKLPKLAGVLSNGAHTLKAKLDPPTGTICKAFNKMRAAADKFDKTPGARILNSDPTKRLLKADKFLTTFEQFAQTLEAIEQGKTTVCPGFVNTYKELVEMKESCERITQPVTKFNTQLRHITNTLSNKVQRPVQRVERVVRTLSRGPLGAVSRVASALARTKVKLPRAATKHRGVGKVPMCCPPGYVNTAGLCYKRCDSGWQTLGLVCMQRCRRGYATVGFTCVRKNVFKAKVYTRKTRKRFGSAPAVHSKHACACRRDGRTHLGGGLCYRKCGKGRFAGYDTSLLTGCMDTRLKQYTVEELAKKLDIFDKIKKVPGIGDILRIADKIIDKVLRPVEKLAFKAFDLIKLPSLDFTAIKLDLGVVPDVVHRGINKIEEIASTVPIVDFELNGFCIDISLEK